MADAAAPPAVNPVVDQVVNAVDVAPPAPGAPAAAPAEAPQGPVRRFLGRMWGRLTRPTTHTVAEYANHKLAQIVNEELDGGAQGPAHDTEMGQAVTLVVEHLLTEPGDGELRSPVGILADHATAYGYKRWDYTRQAPGAQPEAPFP